MRILWLLPLAFSFACSRGPITGGACEYKKFSGQCRLDGAPAIEAPAPDGTTTVKAVYQLPAGGIRYWTMRWRIDAKKANELVAHLTKNAPAPCSGEHIVSGSCTPLMVTVDVPPFAGAALQP